MTDALFEHVIFLQLKITMLHNAQYQYFFQINKFKNSQQILFPNTKDFLKKNRLEY